MRAVRRHHKRRMKKKARRIFPDDPHAEYLADHMAFCSKYCCGHIRELEGPTRQELKFAVEDMDA